MKRPVVLILAILMVFTFSSCKNAGGSASASASASAAATATIKSATPAMTATAAVAASPTASAALTADKYFRFEADVHMNYAYTTGSQSTIDTYVEFLKGNKMQIRALGDMFVSQTVYSYAGGAVINDLFENDRAYRSDLTGVTPVAAETEIMIKEPIQVGTTWTLADGSIRTITSINAQVDVPAGKYTAVEVTTDRSNIVAKQYYAAGVGLVKSTGTPKGAGDSIEYVLKSVTTGKPLVQTVRFYFPDGQNEKLSYIDRPVSLMTNELFGPALAAELKSPPGSGEIGVSLTAGTGLLGLEIRNDGTLAYINLSKEFVNEMNAGATYESLMLKAVVDTVGNYFTVANVVLEIEGQPYASGHFLFAKDEAMKVDTSIAVPFN